MILKINGQKHFGSEPENMHNFMDWEDDSGIERLDSCTGKDGAPSADPNLISGCLNSQPSTSGCIGQKRKSNFSSPLATKISRNICKEEQQQEAQFSVNKTNLNKISEVAPVSQMMLDEPYDLSSSVTSDNKSSASVSGCMDSSNSNISAYAMHNTSTAACQSRTFPSCQDLDVVKEKNILSLDTGGLATHTNGISITCNFCHSKWVHEENLRRHFTSHTTDDKFTVRNHLSNQKREKDFRCPKCGMFSSGRKHHAICVDSSDSDN